MKIKCISKNLGRIFGAFNMREIPSNPELSDCVDSVFKLEFDGIALGKSNMRNDLKRFGHDFKISASEAGKELKEKGRLVYQ